tara:strand:- start:2398 stop:3201 length:804 start_codon:yes stop_codon:yes gene_type:complete
MPEPETEQPPTLEQFAQWSSEDTCGLLNEDAKRWYTINQNSLYVEASERSLFADFSEILEDVASRYRQEHKAELFAFGRKPKLFWHRKTYPSFLEKLFRLNQLENENFPEPPAGGWVGLHNCFATVDDLVRTTFVVAYADGPPFLIEHLRREAQSRGLSSRVRDHAKEKGYYANHLYIELPVSFAASVGGAITEQRAQVEIQVTTELQGALREITHKLYEKERVTGLGADWKHDFESERFRAAYMSHSLRFIEAMIVDLRRRVEEQE